MQLPVDERLGGETAPPAPSPDWHALPVEQVFDRLTTGPQGLSGDAARDRLDRYGTNRLDDRRRIGWPHLVVRQFQNVLILILVVAVAISLAIGERVDAAAVAAIILLNAALGFIQEWRAERALDALRRGAQGLTEQMMGQGEGPGSPNGPSPLDEDPLGRPRRTEGPDFNNRVQIPDEIDVQRARRILEELRRRFSDPSRPKLELDYLERLLKRY